MAVTIASAEDYEQQLNSLLPPGPAWTTPDPLLRAFADDFARVHARALQLIEEGDPRTTVEMFSDWERNYGLPDACVSSDQTLGQRRAALIARVTGLGGQSRAYFTALAAALGHTITITEFHPHSVNDSVAAPITGEEWAYVWQVNTAIAEVFQISVNDTVADPLAAWSNEALECVMNRLKPAHTIVLFAYT